MMLHQVPALTLLPRQTRMINAVQGIRLEVRGGCLWLTRPGDGVDRFLVSGSMIELHESQVLIQCHQHPRGTPEQAAQYVLMPLHASAAAEQHKKFDVLWQRQASALKGAFSAMRAIRT